MRVAVIGTGIAGNAAAWALSKRYPVTVYDRELRPGGHSHTVTVDYDGTRVAVDIGFIVYNELNYPDLTALFAHLGVETVESCMSFAVTADAGRFEWKGGGLNWRATAEGLFAQRRNLLSPSYLWMLRDILTFNQQSIEDYAAGRLAGLTLGEYFKSRHFAPRLLTDGRRDLVGAGDRDAGLSGRELCRLLQQSPPAAIRPADLAHRQGRQPVLCRKADSGVSRPGPARLRRDLDRSHAAWRRGP
jgi:phytoene dehydrogenase-like protein